MEDVEVDAAYVGFSDDTPMPTTPPATPPSSSSRRGFKFLFGSSEKRPVSASATAAASAAAVTVVSALPGPLGVIFCHSYPKAAIVQVRTSCIRCTTLFPEVAYNY